MNSPREAVLALQGENGIDAGRRNCSLCGRSELVPSVIFSSSALLQGVISVRNRYSTLRPPRVRHNRLPPAVDRSRPDSSDSAPFLSARPLEPVKHLDKARAAPCTEMTAQHPKKNLDGDLPCQQGSVVRSMIRQLFQKYQHHSSDVSFNTGLLTCYTMSLDTTIPSAKCALGSFVRNNQSEPGMN